MRLHGEEFKATGEMNRLSGKRKIGRQYVVVNCGLYSGCPADYMVVRAIYRGREGER